jgi:hypothetical protein
MAMPIDACSKHEVEVEFVDSRERLPREVHLPGRSRCER